MECTDQQAVIDEMKTEKQKFCQPLITKGKRFKSEIIFNC